ncbi:hypothetical protein [Variovorax boronicumulans]|uniref:hypothetical protein n=1 Tax=Variovorax boronicumulans TaxID=436515 RepID=UPI0033931957
MAVGRVLRIENENQASAYLERALAGQFEGKDIEIVFSNWPILSIRAKGEGYDSTITPDMAGALVEIQHAMNRAYARFVHNSGNARVLTADERQDIQFKAKVKRGSSLMEINVGEFAEKLTTALVGKMSSTEIVVTVLGIAFIGGSAILLKSFLKDRAEEKKADIEFRKTLSLSQEETKRLEVVTRALSEQPRLRAAQEDFDESRREILRSVGDAKTLEVNGIEMSNAVVRSISTASRQRAKEIQLNGNYRIFKIDWQQEQNVRLWLAGGDRSGEFIAALGTETITAQHRELLKEAEWGRKTLYMQINATELRGEITTARIVSVAWPRDRRKPRPVDSGG